MFHWLVKYIKSLLNTLFYSVIVVMTIALGYFTFRIFVADQFVIPSDSMSPTLLPGDRVWVNKLICGARIYNDIDSVGNRYLKSWRTRGLRRVKHNDIIVFNFPINNHKIGFKLNHVYVKRCVALPGDTICIDNGYYKNNNFPYLLGLKEPQVCLKNTPDSVIPNSMKYTLPFDFSNYPWTIKKFGPLYVPRKGDVITINAQSLRFYFNIIEYETNKKITTDAVGRVYADDVLLDKYIFRNNYYFVVGDNIFNSSDSRFWGFVPEDYIVGVVNFIFYSKEIYSGEICWDRVLKFL